ncbi:MAG: biotin-dependent carboxyltransferase family protein [Proteobacteria bacterium]|nr:biotin-dependent carboxyltransferase family protein [Pseudomonadota bacterium]
MTAALRVLNPGLHTTVQDFGRTGSQRFGIPVSGALDLIALRTANVLVGNPQSTAALEIAALGPALEIEAKSVRVALAACSGGLEVVSAGGDKRLIPPLESVRLVAGDRVAVKALSGTAVAYLAVEGGFDLVPFLGSLSTFIRGSFGGLDGRALKAGDRLPLLRDEVADRGEVRLADWRLEPATEVRVVLGPQDDYFTPEAIATFLGEPYTLTRDADRMGMRFEGAKIAHAKGYDIVSDGIAPGAIQVPGSGQPIVMVVDRQVTGGYPKIATVISSDLAALGRMLPGMRVKFTQVSVAEAHQIRRELEAVMANLMGRLIPAATGPNLERLYDANLVSGVIDAGNPLR